MVTSKVSDKYTPLKSQLFDLIDNFNTSGLIFADGNRNTIKLFDIDNFKINVKSFKKPHLLNSIIYKYFRKSKSRRSFEYANMLLENEIGTPQPIAYVEKSSIFGLNHSYFISEHLECDSTLGNIILNLNYPNRDEIIREYTSFFFKIHEKKIEFIDNSLGNTLIIINENKYCFYLVDLNRLNINKTLSIESRMKNFSRLTLDQSVWNIISEQYAVLFGIYTADELYLKIKKYSLQFHHKIAIKRNLKQFKFFYLKNLDALNR